MRKLSFIFIIGVMFLASCSMRDDNGLLGGNWRTNNNVSLAVFTELAQWQIDNRNEYLLGYFRHTDDSLVFTLKDGQRRGLYHNCWTNDVKDTLITQANHLPNKFQERFQMPENFGFRIQKLSTDSLVLEAEGRVLRFRRY